MNEFRNMTSSEKIVAMIDGEIQSEETTTLFYELAQNSELQDELREHLAMRQFFVNKQTIPPEYLKHKLLAATGLGSFFSLATAKMASSTIGSLGLAALKSKLMMILSSAIVGSLLTFYFTNNYGIDEFSTTQTPIPIIHSFEIYEPAQVEQHEENIGNSTVQNRQRTTKVNFISDNTNASNDNNNDLPVPIEENHLPSIMEIENSRIYTQDIQYSYNDLDNQDILSGIEVYNFEQYMNPQFLEQFSLHIRGFTTRSIPELNIPPLDSPVMNNIALGLFYKFNKNMLVGIEVGQENFMQDYYKYEFGDIRKGIKQNYTAFWTGLSLQYNIIELDDIQNFYPFTRVFAGGTNVGPLLRGMIGLQFDFEDSFSIFTGIETTSLIYRYSGNTFSTHKLGLTFGGHVNF